MFFFFILVVVLEISVVFVEGFDGGVWRKKFGGFFLGFFIFRILKF